ncbi:histidine kinase [Larkinella sp. VNQ87]|uniref:sensor histidine kinase n=1 Tax=Larkinella sp. VNQ87 TaxID=3400921 RepID=UPI003C0AB685
MRWLAFIRRILLTSGFLTGLTLACAQRFANQSYGIGEGLDNVRTYFLQTDLSGRIWVATDWGLDFFDREHQLINSRKLPRLPQGLINDLAVGPDGSVWVAGNKLYRLQVLSNLDLRVDTTGVGYAPHFNRIGTSFLTVDHQNRAWFTGSADKPFVDQGLCYLENGRIHDLTARLFPKQPPRILDLRADWHHRRVLIAMKDGTLWQYRNGTISRIPLDEPVLRILQRPSRQLYALTRSSLYRLTGHGTDKVYKIPPALQQAEVYALSDREEVAFLNLQKHLCWFDGQRLTDSGVKTAPVRSLLFDRQGDLWAGTIKGITRVMRAGWRFFDEAGGWSEETVSATEDRRGTLWFATRGQGLTRLARDRIVPDSAYYRSLPTKDFIAATNRDADGNLIFSTVGGKGLLWFDGNQYRMLPGSAQGTNIRGFYDDVAQNRYLFATSKKLLIYDRRTLKLKQSLALPSTGYYDIEKDRFGQFWLGGQESAVIWDGHSDRFKTLPYAGNLSAWMIFDLHRDPRGNLWLATDQGLWLYDYKRFRRVLPQQLQRVVNFCQPLESSFLMLGAIEGLYVLDVRRFYEKGEEWVAWFDQKNGFGGQCISHGCFRDRQQRWWLPTHDRIMMIPEADLKKLLVSVPTGIHSFRDARTGRVYKDHLDELRFNSDQNHLEINFWEPSGQHLFANTVYRYRLERLDDPQPDADWSDPVQNSTLSFKNLSDGTYRLTLQILRANGLWHARPVVQVFQIAPPWWATGWFRTLVILVLAGGIFAIILRQFRAQARREREILEAKQRVTELELEAAYRQNLEVRMSQELAEASRERALLEVRAITNQIDPHFVSNFLTAVQSMLYRQESELVVRYLAKFGSIFRHKLLSRSQVFWSLGEELDFVGNYLELEKVRFRQRIQSTTEIEPGVPLDTIIPKMLIQGYVSNAIKHGLENKPEGGTVRIRIGTTERHLRIVVEDDGVGLEKARHYRRRSTGRGLAINQALFDQLNQYNSLKSRQYCTDLNENGQIGVRVEAFLPLYPALPPEELVTDANA